MRASNEYIKVGVRRRPVHVLGEIARLPHNVGVGSVAPGAKRVPVWVSAVVMVSKARSWEIFSGVASVVRLLRGPMLASVTVCRDGQGSIVVSVQLAPNPPSVLNRFCNGLDD